MNKGAYLRRIDQVIGRVLTETEEEKMSELLDEVYGTGAYDREMELMVFGEPNDDEDDWGW